MEIILNLLPVYFLAIVVAVLKAKKVFAADTSKYLTPILFKIAAPALIFSILSQTEVDLGTLALLGYSFVLFLVFGIVFFVFKRFAGASEKSQLIALIGGISFAIGTVAYPIIQASFVPEVFAQVVIIDLSLVIMFLIVAPILASGKFDGKSAMKLLLTDPILWSVYLGIFCSIAKVQIPQEVMKIFSFASGGFSFLSAVILGLVVTIPTLEQLKKVASMTVVKMGAWVLLGLLIWNLPISLFTKQALVMSISSPVGLFPIIYAEQYKLDKEFVAQWAIVNTFLMVLLYPILVTILQ